MEELKRSCSLQKAESYLNNIARRSYSSLLVIESISSSEWMPLPQYERLSQSMRFFGEPELKRQRKVNNIWKRVGRVFSGRYTIQKLVDGKPVNNCCVEEKKIVKKRSKWLPDPDRRWPVQGW